MEKPDEELHTLDFYQILEVDCNATQRDVNVAFRRLARIHHPDKNIGDGAATQRFQAIQNAHSCLSDEVKRSAYDRKLREAEEERTAHRNDRVPSGSRQPRSSSGQSPNIFSFTGSTPYAYRRNPWESSNSHFQTNTTPHSNKSPFSDYRNPFLHSFHQPYNRESQIPGSQWSAWINDGEAGGRHLEEHRRNILQYIARFEKHSSELKFHVIDVKFRFWVCFFEHSGRQLTEEIWRLLEQLEQIVVDFTNWAEHIRKMASPVSLRTAITQEGEVRWMVRAVIEGARFRSQFYALHTSLMSELLEKARRYPATTQYQTSVELYQNAIRSYLLTAVHQRYGMEYNSFGSWSVYDRNGRIIQEVTHRNRQYESGRDSYLGEQ